MKTKLWTKDFTLITFGTIISAIASQVISLPMSLMVFDKTQSAFLAALIFVFKIVPYVVIPLLVAPFIDHLQKKPIIVGLDYLLAAFYLVVGLVVKFSGFNYLLFVLTSVIIGSIGSTYSIAYRAWYPDLISKGLEQKGYAVSGTIYPTVTIVFAPVAAYLYSVTSIDKLFLGVAALLFIAATAELFIAEIHSENGKKITSLHRFLEDFREGLIFIKRERGIRNIYIYMGIANGVGLSNSLMTQTFFQTTLGLTAAMLGLLKSAETIGRLLGGVFQYKFTIKPQKRYGITKVVYIFYDTMDMILLFLPYPLMLINRFACGAMGMTSLTIREAAVQSYLPSDMRAKVNAFFSAYSASVMVLFQLSAGYLGDLFGFRKVVVLLSAIGLLCVVIFIVLPQRVNRQVYQATRTE